MTNNHQPTSPIHIIAEAGTNHGGSLKSAKQLVNVALEAGADSVKFQIIYPEGLYLMRLLQPDGSYLENEVANKRRAMMLTDDEWRQVAAYSREKGIAFSASVFDRRGIQLLDELDVPFIKIASTDLNNSPLLIRAAETGRKLIISTGMSTLAEIDHAVSDIINATGNDDIVLLHCVSVYPATIEQMNIGFLKTLKSAFGLPVGLSDHTESSLAAAMAVSLGIEWVEKHFTLDRKADGFDHAYAMEPSMMATYISDIRGCEVANRPSHVKRLTEAESGVRARARRGLHAARDIAEGEVITPDDVLIVRPPGPLSPNDVALVTGKTARRLIRQYEALSLDQVV